MARTDKTRPWWVRAIDARPLQHHDHRTGVCTLPSHPQDQLGDTSPRTGCYWTESIEMYYGRDSGCGCKVCTDQPGRRARGRQERHRSKLTTGWAVRGYQE